MSAEKPPRESETVGTGSPVTKIKSRRRFMNGVLWLRWAKCKGERDAL